MSWRVGWREKLGRPECPYVHRWMVGTPFGSVRLHHWVASDDDRHLHTHPWWFATIVLKGGYTDVSSLAPDVPTGAYIEDREVYYGIVHDKLNAGSFRRRPADHAHTVQVDPGGCWSIIVTGPEATPWGFWVDGKWRKRNRYFFDHGDHPCD